MPKCYNRILFHYADILWAAIRRDYRDCITFYPKSVPAKFQKYFKHISWVISGTNSSKLTCNPRHPSRNISCNHRHHLLQPSWRRIFSTSNNQKTMVDSDINIDYKASSFDKLDIQRRKWDTAGFVRAHQRKYWNALTVGRGHADDGCSCNHRAVPPSVKVGGGENVPGILGACATRNVTYLVRDPLVQIMAAATLPIIWTNCSLIFTRSDEKMYAKLEYEI